MEKDVVSAQVMRNREWKDALEQIRLKNPDGLLVPAEVVREASNPEHPLHDEFTWDDSEAAEKWRLEEARKIIRVVVEYEDCSRANNVPAFVSLMTDRQREEGGYRPTALVISSDELRQQLLATAKAELKAWAARHKMLTELVTAVVRAAGLDEPAVAGSVSPSSKPKTTHKKRQRASA